MMHSELRPSGDGPARGHWLPIARKAWAAVAVLTVLLFLTGIPQYWAQLQPCLECAGEIGPIYAPVRLGQGLSPAAYATWVTFFECLLMASFVAIALIIYLRRPNDKLALLGAFWLVTFGTIFTGASNAVGQSGALGYVLFSMLGAVGGISSLLFFCLFPSGTFVPRWTRWPFAVWALANVVGYIVPAGSVLHEQGPVFGFLVIGAVLVTVIAQVYRYRRVSDPTERQQVKWVVLGFTLAMTGMLSETFLVAPRLQGETPVGLGLLLGDAALFYLSLTLIPLSIAFAIFRYRLWDIDLLINRALVYGLLTTAVILIYVLAVSYLGAVFHTEGSQVISLAATGLVAVLFQPIRERLQRSVNHLLYGHRDEPYTVISRLSQRLESTLDPDALLTSIAEVVAQALKLPYAAVTIRQEESFATAATFGAPTGEPVVLPLIYQTEVVGQLLLGTRRPGEPFTPADQPLMDELARQAAAAVNAVRLTEDLRRTNQHLTVARERLVTAREEERRRLRHDLHDGLSPALAAFSLKLGAIRKLLRRSPEAAEALVVELSGELERTIGDVRRMVHGLRPPALDQLGLIEAIRSRAAQFAVGSEGLRVMVQAPDRLPPLPAAVEVAAYLIAQEALTNVARHAKVHGAELKLWAEDDGLHLEVADQGRGLPPDRKPGVGLLSMRERCVELGGTCSVEPMATGGTRVRAFLPLTKE